ncbi:uncharacterized protein LOC124454992 [Xenia sp. Carnegie-2017]|uniref:uncharacterized protein LOC124454992 n=1 Tax=Xenia sp. Carnegie-2017 TaxID=2897299 RepID=UPI001F0346E1|nr:uncharacterized protein LOC124454992 [Xenia sp. Carnegie-2017]
MKNTFVVYFTLVLISVIFFLLVNQIYLFENKGEIISRYIMKEYLKKKQDNQNNKDSLILKVVKSLEQPFTNTDLSHIFKGDLFDNRSWEFDLSGLSARRFGQSYVEQTSFDANGRNTDFYNPVGFYKDGLLLFEDNGPGIFHRLLWFHRADLKINMDYVSFEVDGKEVKELPVIFEANETLPFLEPFIRVNNVSEFGGFYLTFPIAYSTSFRVIIRWQGSQNIDTEQAWTQSISCRVNGTYCDISGYYAVTTNKLTNERKLKSLFNEYFLKEKVLSNYIQDATTAFSKMAREPENFAPGLRSQCSLSCHKVEPNEEIIIYHAHHSAMIIESMRLRIYDKINNMIKISENWRRILITMQWDDKEPQVKDIPLAGIFITGLDFLREVKSLTTGLRYMTCSVEGDYASQMELYDWTAYLYYEMPFWKSAKISVKIPHGFDSAIVCSQLSTKTLSEEKYHHSLTGYFSAQVNQQGFDYSHHKNIFHLEKQWGHVVAVNFFLRNDKIASTHELDVIIETNDAIAPIFPGTGLEDFFHYVHDFHANKNRTSLFNGAPYYFRKRRFRILRCFRHNTLDPIIFTTGIRIYLESRFDRSKSANYRNFMNSSLSFSQKILRDSLFTVTLYYGNKGSGGVYSDVLNYHERNNTLSKRLHFSPQQVRTFAIQSMYEDQPGMLFDKMVVSMEPGQKVVHTLKILPKNVGIILRREYHSMVPNQKAKVSIDGDEAGVWFCPQRAIKKMLSLRFNDHLLPLSHTFGKSSIEVTLTAITRWETIAIQVLSVLLND